VQEDPDGGLVAVCTCGDGDCDTFRLEPEHTVIHALNRRVFGEAVARVLGLLFAGPWQESPGNRAVEIGRHAPLHAPVNLYFPDSEAALLREVEDLIGASASPFLLLTPTSSFYSPQTDGALKRASCARLALSAALEVEVDGGFRLSESVEPFLTEWAERIARGRENGAALRGIQRELAALRKGLGSLPSAQEPPDEDVARRAFALVQKLDADRPIKPPTLLTVFRLYCMEEFSAGQIARKLHCSKPTILRRLAHLRDRTGVDPKALRRFSPHLSKLEEDIADSRARHIHRRCLIDDGGDES
jgi:hypothetical protein